MPDAYTQTKQAEKVADTYIWKLENTLKRFSVTVEKQADFDTGETFAFRIKITKNSAANGSADSRREEIQEFFLSKDESVTFHDIPYGSGYEVWEADYNNNKVNIGDEFHVSSAKDISKWTLKSSTNAEGILTQGDVKSVFVNEIKRGTVNVKKTTFGNEPGKFDFVIRFVNPYDAEFNDSSTYAGAGIDVKKLATDDNLVQGKENTWEYAFNLANGEEINFANVPYGFSYEVSESLADGWQLVNVDSDTKKTKGEGSVTETSPAPKHVFFNKKPHVIIIEKEGIKNNNSPKDQDYNFEIEITNAPNEVITVEVKDNYSKTNNNAKPATVSVSRPSNTSSGTPATASVSRPANTSSGNSSTTSQQVKTDSKGTATVKVPLKKDQQAVIKGVPFGASYKVTEVDGEGDGYKTKPVIEGDSTTGEELGTGTSIASAKEYNKASDSFISGDTTLTFGRKRVGALPVDVHFAWLMILSLFTPSIVYSFSRVFKKRKQIK